MLLRRMIYYLQEVAQQSQQSSGPDLFTAFSNPQFQAFSTTVTNDLSADGFTWSQAFPLQYDSYGNKIITSQRADGRTIFTFQNVGGAWEDNTGINDLSNLGEVLVRRSFVYDSVNDILHGYLYYNAEVAVYRRYEITRNGEDIDTIDWTRGVDPNLVFCETVTEYYHPITLYHDEQIICILGVSNGGDSQVIAVRANANNTDALADFTNIGFNSSDAIATWLTASYSTIATNTVNANAANPSACIQSDGTLFVAYTDNLTYRFKRIPYNGSAWTPLGSAQLLCDLTLAGTNTGYTFKTQLISRPVQIGDDIYIAVAVWASNVLGDTVRIAKITPDNTVSFVNVYSANGAHSYAPTFDIMTVDGRIIITYLKTNDGGTYIRAYDTDLAPVTNEFLLYDTNESDIPLLAPEVITGSPRQLRHSMRVCDCIRKIRTASRSLVSNQHQVFSSGCETKNECNLGRWKIVSILKFFCQQ